MRLFVGRAYDAAGTAVGLPVTVAAKTGPAALRKVRKHYAADRALLFATVAVTCV